MTTSLVQTYFETASAETKKALATTSVGGPESYREKRIVCNRKFTLRRKSYARSGRILHQARYKKPSDEE